MAVVDALAELASSHRVIEVRIGGRPLWAAIEDAARLRDAMGVQPPAGVPHVFLQPVDDPLADVVGRYARTHGPFTSAADRQRPGPAGWQSPTPPCAALETAGRVARGVFRSGAEREWVDLEVLRRLKRRSLAVLRQQIEPVEGSALGRFAPEWQRATGQPARGRAALGEAIRRLQGVDLAASVLERDVLPLRVADHGPLLDQLMLEGEVVWAGRGPLGGGTARSRCICGRSSGPSGRLPRSIVPRARFTKRSGATSTEKVLPSSTTSIRQPAAATPRRSSNPSGIWCGPERSPTTPWPRCGPMSSSRGGPGRARGSHRRRLQLSAPRLGALVEAGGARTRTHRSPRRPGLSSSSTVTAS